jgi:hypothetical protein
MPQVPKLWGAPPPPGEGAVGPMGGRVDCMSDILILNETWAQGKIDILTGTLLD